jgi:hypothetical protein
VNPEQEVIKLYAKQLKLATLVNIDELIRQAEENSQGYATFLSEVLKREINQREENRQRRQVSNFTLLELNKTFTLSFSTPLRDLAALSIFWLHDGQVKVSSWIS